MEPQDYLRLADLNNTLYQRMLESQSQWLKHLSLSTSTLLGLLIGLYDKPADNPAHSFCMACGISLLTLSSVCSLLLLYFSMPWSAKKNFSTFRDQISSCCRTWNNFPAYGKNPPRWLTFVRIVLYLSLGLSFVLFALSFWTLLYPCLFERFVSSFH